MSRTTLLVFLIKNGGFCLIFRMKEFLNFSAVNHEDRLIFRKECVKKKVYLEKELARLDKPSSRFFPIAVVEF